QADGRSRHRSGLHQRCRSASVPPRPARASGLAAPAKASRVGLAEHSHPAWPRYVGVPMRGPDDLTHADAVRLRPRAAVALVVVAAVITACATGSSSGQGLAAPQRSVVPDPDYTRLCAPVGADSSSTCLRLTLQAIDTARAREGVRPMALPGDFASLTVPEQLFVAVDRERVDRGLAPFSGLSASLDAGAQRGAERARLPPRPGHDFTAAETEWIGAVDNGLDADFQWMYDDGPD